MDKHPVTGMEIEDGHGALPEQQQVVNHLHYIAQTRGEEAADAMRVELGLPTSAEMAAAAADAEDTNAAEHKALSDRITRLEDAFAALGKPGPENHGGTE